MGCSLRYKPAPLQGHREALGGKSSPGPNTDHRLPCNCCVAPSTRPAGPSLSQTQGGHLPHPQAWVSPTPHPTMSEGAPRPRAALIWLLQSQAPPPDPSPADRRYLLHTEGSVNGFKKHFSSFSNSLENTYYFGGVRHPPCLGLESVTPMTSLGGEGRGGWQEGRYQALGT